MFTSNATTPTTTTVSAGTMSAGSDTNTLTGISLAKLAGLRSSYLVQLKDLHSLYESGAISETELQEQKAPILDYLKRLVPE